MDQVIGNTARLKELNIELVREALKSVGDATKQSLARATGLSAATCGNVLAELLRTGEARELDAAESNGGRPARKFAYNPGYSMLALLHLGIESGVRTLTWAVTDAIGRVLEQEARHFPALTQALIGEVLSDLNRRYPALKAAAISYPGVVCHGRIDAWGDLEELWSCELQTELETAFPGLRIAVENDMNLAAWGYDQAQPETARADLAYLAFFNDIPPGCGVIANGQLVRGRNGFAGEVAALPGELSREAQLAGLRTGEGRVRAISRSILTVTALLNPATVVLCGRMFADPALREAIDAACRQTLIGEKYLPQLVYRDNWLDDVLNGLLACGMASLRCPVQLIRR